MHPIKQLPCHKLYVSVFLCFTSILTHSLRMLIPHDNGRFCTEMDKSEQLLTY
jgi:hypothetical protein